MENYDDILEDVIRLLSEIESDSDPMLAAIRTRIGGINDIDYARESLLRLCQQLREHEEALTDTDLRLAFDEMLRARKDLGTTFRQFQNALHTNIGDADLDSKRKAYEVALSTFLQSRSRLVAAFDRARSRDSRGFGH